MKEIWKVIEEDPRYRVSNLGRVRSPYKILKPSDHGNGYVKVWLGRSKSRYVHRLVAEAFLPNLDMLRVVHHIDNDKSNNCVDNLEWASDSYNLQMKFFDGLQCSKGESHSQAKLKEEDVLLIRDLYPKYTYKELACKFSVSLTNIQSIVKRRSWRHI